MVGLTAPKWGKLGAELKAEQKDDQLEKLWAKPTD